VVRRRTYGNGGIRKKTALAYLGLLPQGAICQVKKNLKVSCPSRRVQYLTYARKTRKEEVTSGQVGVVRELLFWGNMGRGGDEDTANSLCVFPRGPLSGQIETEKPWTKTATHKPQDPLMRQKGIHQSGRGSPHIWEN